MEPEASALPSGLSVTTVVFVCPHGAAKSVMAGSYFNRFAAQLGLNVQATARGTEPDSEISERVRQDVGPALCVDRPTQFSAADVESGDLVVSFDLAEPELGVAPHRAWNALPALSGDFELGRAAILGRVVALVAELKARSNQGAT